MPNRLEPINAIAYAQFHLRGGVRGLLLTMLGTLLLVGIIAVPFFAGQPDRTQVAARGATYMLLVIQWLVLTLFGASRVMAAVRSDLSSGLIESHRLTPASPLASVAGYIVAAPIQAIAVAAVVLPSGAATTFIAGMPISYWLVGNVMALGAAVLLWSLAALATLATRQAALVPAAGVIAGAMSAVLVVVPAIMVIASPVAGQTLWQIRGNAAVAPAYLFTFVADMLLTGVFLLAAARRYRSVATDAFNIPLGLLLLAIWAAITIVGLAEPTMFWNAGAMGRLADDRAQLLAGLGSSMAIALLPVAALARAAVTPPDMLDPGRRRIWPPLAWLCLPVCIVLAWSAAGVMFTETIDNLAERQCGTAIVIAVSLTSAALWIAAADLRGRTGWVPAIVWLALTNIVPMLIAAILQATGPNHTPLPPHVTAASPLASLALIWDPDLIYLPLSNLPRGITIQAACMLVPLAYFLVRIRQGRPGTRPPTIDNAASAAAE